MFGSFEFADLIISVEVDNARGSVAAKGIEGVWLGSLGNGS